MLPGDTEHTEVSNLSTPDTGDISEDESPNDTAGMIAAIGPENYVLVKKTAIRYACGLMASTTALCLGAVAIHPQPVVYGCVVTIWGSSAAFARRLVNKR